MIIKAIRFVLISLFMVLYWPVNMLFLLMKKSYFKWKQEDRVSYIIATPLYYFFFVVAALLSLPLEIMGDKAHPPLDGFR
jgi:hypothetical protein